MLRKHARLYFPDAPAGIPAAPAAAAPAPAPAPAAAPAAAAPAAPAAAAAAPADDGGGDPFADAALDAAFAKAGTPSPAAPAGDKGAPPKGGAPAAPAPKPAGAPAAPAAPVGPKELRAELDRVKSELAAAATSRAELERQIAEARAAGESTKALTAQLETEKKERLALLAELRGLKKEKSPEFIAKYDVPFNKLAARAEAVVQTATVNDAAGERPGTFDDFKLVYGLGEVAAHRKATEMFGDAAPVVMRYYSELHRLDGERSEAAAAERAEYDKRTTEEEANRATNQQQINELWERTNRELADKVEDYRDAADDTEAAEVRKKALAIFDTAPRNLKEKIIKDAHIRQLVGTAKVQKLLLARERAKTAALQAELDKLTPTVPGRVRRPGGDSGAAPDKSFEDGLREAVTA